MPSLVRTETITIPSGDTEILAYLAEPSSPGRFGAIVVIQEVFGVNSHIREVAERLARAGYVAIAPHIYHRQAPGFEVGYSQAELELGRSYKQGTKAQELLIDVQGAIAHLYSKANVIPEGVGCIGFCFGGHVAYLAATLPDVKARPRCPQHHNSAKSGDNRCDSYLVPGGVFAQGRLSDLMWP